MRNTLTLLFIALTFGMSAQNWATLAWHTGDDGNELSFDVIAPNGDTIFHGAGYADNQMYSQAINFPDGITTFHIHDSGCNGFNDHSMISLTNQTGQMWHIITSGWCEQSRVSWFEYYDPCASGCPTDFDADGITDVSDLLIFIAAYGTNCE